MALNYSSIILRKLKPRDYGVDLFSALDTCAVLGAMRLQEEFAMLPLKNKPSTSAPFGGCSRPVTRLISSSGPRAGRSSAGATASPCATTSTRAPSSSSCSTRTRFARPASAAFSRSTAWKFFYNTWSYKINNLYFCDIHYIKNRS